MIDFEATMRSIGNDRALLVTLIGIFLEDYPGLLSELEQAAINGNPTAVYGAAHRLKGLVSNFHAESVVERLSEIEMAARSSQRTPAVDTLNQIAELCGATAEELKSLLNA